MNLATAITKLRNVCISLCCSLVLASAARADGPATLVIIIDDIGNHYESGLRAVNLPGKLNLAFLPLTPESTKLAELTRAAGKEVLLHAPMSNLHNKPLGPGALTTGMGREELVGTLNRSLSALPHVAGVSNHMGSELTTQRQPMEWVMSVLSHRGLYFVDSRTSKHTLAATIAEEYEIPHLSRQVFLDNEISRDAIADSFRRLLAKADAEGLGVAIGHPYPETLDYLQEILPTLEASGYRLALISEVLGMSRMAQATTGR